MNLKRVLILNSVSGSWGKISSIIIRLIQVPFFLSFFGVEEYGRWLILTSLPTWLSLANLGFGSVASNEITMEIAAGNNGKAQVIFSTTIALILLITIFASILIISIAPLIPWENLLNVSDKRHEELSLAVVWLGVSVLISFFIELYNSRFRAARKSHTSVFIQSFRPWLDFFSLILVLQFSTRFDYLALSLLFSTALFVFITKWLSWKAFDLIRFSFNNIKKEKFKLLFTKGIAFQAFPLGNAFLYQGNLLIIQSLLGPVAVVLFGTARTLVRSINQTLELINQAIWPELSYLLGANDYAKAARLHRLGVSISIIISFVLVLLMSICGGYIYSFWTHKNMELSQDLLMLFLLPIPFNALWFTSSVVHVACNKHEGLAIRYLIGSSLSLVVCMILSYYYGIEGAALSTLVADLVLIPYVLKRSLLLTKDNWSGFFRGTFQESTMAFRELNKFIKFTL